MHRTATLPDDPPSPARARWENGDDAEEDQPVHAPEPLAGSEWFHRRMATLHELAAKGGWLVHPADLDLQSSTIGRGSVGFVYKGTHVPAGRIVAVKKIRADLEEGSRSWDRARSDLVSEVDMLPTIGQHPNILGFVGLVGSSDDTVSAPSIVLEYMDGGCLQDVLGGKWRNGRAWRPPKATSFSWCAQLCAALRFLHDRDTPLVHRDVKAANLFICSHVGTDRTTLKLGDFGLCRPVKTLDNGDDVRAMTGLTGTLTHMAPEVFIATAGYSEKADIFSAAVCMVSLVTGDSAYEAEAGRYGWRPDVLARQVALNGYRASLESKVKHDALRYLISRMWAQEPGERPSAAECVVELEALLSVVKTGSRKPMAVFKRTFSLDEGEAKDALRGRSSLSETFRRTFSTSRGSLADDEQGSRSPLQALLRRFSRISHASKGVSHRQPSDVLVDDEASAPSLRSHPSHQPSEADQIEAGSCANFSGGTFEFECAICGNGSKQSLIWSASQGSWCAPKRVCDDCVLDGPASGEKGSKGETFIGGV